MSPKRRAPLLLAFAGAALLAAVARPGGNHPQAVVRFDSAEELLRLAGQGGLRCYPGSRVPHLWSGHFVTDRPRERAELESLCKAGCGQMPEWEGVLWVCGLDAPAGRRFDPGQIAGSSRVLAAGDERLIDRLEQLHRRLSDDRRGK